MGISWQTGNHHFQAFILGGQKWEFTQGIIGLRDQRGLRFRPFKVWSNHQYKRFSQEPLKKSYSFKKAKIGVLTPTASSHIIYIFVSHTTWKYRLFCDHRLLLTHSWCFTTTHLPFPSYSEIWSLTTIDTALTHMGKPTHCFAKASSLFVFTFPSTPHHFHATHLLFVEYQND